MSCPNLYNGTAVVTAAAHWDDALYADQYLCDDDSGALGEGLL